MSIIEVIPNHCWFIVNIHQWNLEHIEIKMHFFFEVDTFKCFLKSEDQFVQALLLRSVTVLRRDGIIPLL